MESLELETIKDLHDKAYQSGSVTRERASDDLVFYWVTQWDDSSLQESQLGYRGEFNILRKAGRNILSELAANPIQVDFEPINTERTDGADLLDGLYRADGHSNSSIEAFTNADNENVVCGVGAWALYTDYKNNRDGSTDQVIKRRPIYEAANTVFWDPNAKMLDKSDAKYVSVLAAYSEDGYKGLVEELTGEECDEVVPSNFKQPESSMTFPWILGGSKKVYIAEFYYREKVKTNLLVMEDPLGSSITLYEDELEGVTDDLLDTGFSIVSEKEVERWRVTKYICSGEKVLDESVIAGKHLPIIPIYGERAVVEGEEHYEGVTRLAKDPQRLRNFQLSYLADIVSRSPREKPIFNADQVAGFEDMYSETGAENNYPYLLQNRLAADGSPLPVGPIAMLPAPNIPPALAASVELTRQAIDDVANPGLQQDVVDPDTSGKAVLALQAKFDKQSMVYQEHKKHAQRRDGEVYASMAAEVYDVPREVKVEQPDGTRRTVKTMSIVMDKDSGELVTLHDISNAEFEVFSTIGSSYGSQKDQTRDVLNNMIMTMPQGDPLRDILMLKLLKLVDGVDFGDIRDYANKQLILTGVKKPETPEEQQMLAAKEVAGDKPSPEMVLAQAEMVKGKALQQEADFKMLQLQANMGNETAKRQIESFKAQTGRLDTQIDASEAAVTIDYKRADALGKKLDNQAKVVQLRKPADLSDEELLTDLFNDKLPVENTAGY